MTPIKFVCLNAGNYCGRGAQYVNTLLDMVKRNMPGTTPFEFYCLTDDAAGLDQRIEVLPLPAGLEGWYGKLYLFKRGLFPDGARVVFFDLDTVIVGRLDEIVSYRGRFATLDDFYFPERIGPAVMLWEAGDYAASIWEEWVAQGEPRNQLGDLWWLNNLDQGRFAKRADKLQKLFPGAFVSFKRDCKPLPPAGARVVCFHGQPRPHAADVAWVEETWRVGGLNPADLEAYINTKRDELAANVRAACALGHPWLAMEEAHAGEAAIVGGGPSLERFLPELRAKAADGASVFAVNGAFEYLVSRGIVPSWHVIIDAREENASFITSPPAERYLLASQCSPQIYAKASALAPVTIVHMSTADILDWIPPSLQPINLIHSGHTVGLAALVMSYVMGYRRQYLYGMDSSYAEVNGHLGRYEHHAYPQALNDSDQVIEAVFGGRKWKCAPWMIMQAQDFEKVALELAGFGCEIHVRSHGLLGHLAWLMANTPAGVAA